jgi:hypothetical protein
MFLLWFLLLLLFKGTVSRYDGWDEAMV